MASLKFEELYSVPMTCLRINRAHPSIPRDWTWLWQVTLMHGLFTVGFCSMMYNLLAVDMKTGTFSEICTYGIFLVVWVVITFCYAVILKFTDELTTLIRVNQEYFDAAASLPEEDAAVILEYALRARWVARVWGGACYINGFMFPLKALVLTLYSIYIDDFKLVPLLEGTFPLAIDRIKQTPAMFSAIAAMHSIYAVYATIMYMGFCPLGPIFIINTCAQLEIMTKEFGLIFNVTPYDDKLVAVKLAALIKKSQDIYDYVQIINDVFRIYYEVTLKAAAIMIPITLFLILDSIKQRELCVEFIMFDITATLLCYIPCYYSDLLMEKGEALRLAMYSSGWENQFDKKARASLIILLTVAVRPISISTNFRVVCLDAFAGLCHEAYAIFSLLNAMWE
uniref:Odorant receptor n=1 Tax=Ctenopseustis obliquana TaxID=65030 RepID=A0A097IYN4_9NEOP|nr:olfactory receptor 30 [Ctenopseustis obliquana]